MILCSSFCNEPTNIVYREVLTVAINLAVRASEALKLFKVLHTPRFFYLKLTDQT